MKSDKIEQFKNDLRFKVMLLKGMHTKEDKDGNLVCDKVSTNAHNEAIDKVLTLIKQYE